MSCATPIGLPAPSGYKLQRSGLISRGFSAHPNVEKAQQIRDALDAGIKRVES